MALCVKTGLLLCTIVLMSFIEAGVSYSWNSQARLFSDLDSAVATQVPDTCFLSGALEVCQAARVVKGDYSDYFHVCPKDGDPCNPELCYYTSIRPCCPNSQTNQCNSTSKLLVHGQTFDVNFYDVPRPGFANTVCFKADPSLPACDCQPECIRSPCAGNTVECDDDGNCTCQPNFQSPDCCNCTASNDTHIIYRNETTQKCDALCRRDCATRIPNGPCTSCFRGFAPPDCCNCPPNMTEFNGVCKCDGNTDANGNCKNGFAPQDCCNCPPGLTEVNGVCRCANNTIDDDGNCKEGYLPEDCCNCDTAGNATHAFYKDNGECIPYCKPKCASLESNGKGCETCIEGYSLPPTCCDQDEVPCSREQSIYFLIDATGSYELNNFCRTVTLIQLLVAAFNPSASGPTKTYGYLFPNGDDIWSSNDGCTSTVEGKLTSLMEERRDKCSTSTVFPDICGDSTLAVPGLNVIKNVANTTTTPQAVLIFTDGNIQDINSQVETAVSNLANSGVSTIIAAGLGQVDQNNLERFILPAGMSANAVVNSNIKDLGVSIVARLNATGILCKDHANNITTLLNDLTTAIDDTYCACVPKVNCLGSNLQYKYPKCGGPLQIGYETVNMGPTMNLEEEIIAAVEGVLEDFQKG